MGCCLYLTAVSVSYISGLGLGSFTAVFVQDRYKSNFILLHVGIQCSQHHLLTRLLFSSVCFWHLWVKLCVLAHVWVFNYSSACLHVCLCQFHIFYYYSECILRSGIVTFWYCPHPHSQECFGCSGSFVEPYEFWIVFFCFCKKMRWEFWLELSWICKSFW